MRRVIGQGTEALTANPDIPIPGSEITTLYTRLPFMRGSDYINVALYVLFGLIWWKRLKMNLSSLRAPFMIIWFTIIPIGIKLGGCASILRKIKPTQRIRLPF